MPRGGTDGRCTQSVVVKTDYHTTGIEGSSARVGISATGPKCAGAFFGKCTGTCYNTTDGKGGGTCVDINGITGHIIER